MDKLDTMLERLANGPGLTRYECLRLVMLAQHAAKFTEANDRADDADERIGAGGMAAADAADDESENYNRTKDDLFQSVREFMGWPGRPVKYLPEFLSPGRERVTPHPFEQEGGEG